MEQADGQLLIGILGFHLRAGLHVTTLTGPDMDKASPFYRRQIGLGGSSGRTRQPDGTVGISDTKVVAT